MSSEHKPLSLAEIEKLRELYATIEKRGTWSGDDGYAAIAALPRLLSMLQPPADAAVREAVGRCCSPQEYDLNDNLLLVDRAALLTLLAHVRAAQAQREGTTEANMRKAWCPDVCPITGLEFFMWIEQREGGRMVPTYGGPYDSYTIPVRCADDGSYIRERYDHDNGAWTDYEDIGVLVVDEGEHSMMEDELASLRAAQSPRLTEEQSAVLREAYEAIVDAGYNMIAGNLRDEFCPAFPGVFGGK